MSSVVLNSTQRKIRAQMRGDKKWLLMGSDPQKVVGILSGCKVIVIGCVQSGTQYISKVLSATGLSVGHELIKSDGVSDGAYTFLNFPEQDFRTYAILHQVKEPLRTISGIKLIPRHIWARLEDRENWPNLAFVGINSEDSNTLKRMKYWYAWNLKAQYQADLTYRVEAIDEVWPQICELVGTPDGGGVPSIPRDINSHADAYEMDGWADLFACDEELTRKIIDLATRYGYGLP